MVTSRRGATKLGCLMTLLVVAAIGYFGANAGERYWRFYNYQDAMKQEVMFRAKQPIPQLRARLRQIADSLGLPEDAGIVSVRRTANEIFIEAHYEEVIEFPGFKREVHFEPKAQGRF